MTLKFHTFLLQVQSKMLNELKKSNGTYVDYGDYEDRDLPPGYYDEDYKLPEWLLLLQDAKQYPKVSDRHGPFGWRTNCLTHPEQPSWYLTLGYLWDHCRKSFDGCPPDDHPFPWLWQTAPAGGWDFWRFPCLWDIDWTKRERLERLEAAVSKAAPEYKEQWALVARVRIHGRRKKEIAAAVYAACESIMVHTH